MTRRITSRVLDFSGGIIGGISDYGRRVRHLRVAENVLLRPHGALSVRKGSKRLSSVALTKKPHTIAEWVPQSGTAKVFVMAEDTAGLLYEATAGAFTQQTTPYALHTSAKAVWDQLQGSLWVVQQAGTAPPIFFRSGNPTNTWHSARLPRPAFPDIPDLTPVVVVSGTATLPPGTVVSGAVAAGATTMTLSNVAGGITGDCVLRFGTAPATFDVPNCQLTNPSATVTYDGPAAAAQVQMTLAGAGGGGLTAGTTYYYRLRFRYLNGCSKATMNTHSIAMGANTLVNVSTIANEIRSDYLGWTLERTKAGGTANGPFYWVANGTGATYPDSTADADLGYLSDENAHGEPVHMDGVLTYKDRLVGWSGSTLYVSQSVGDIEFTGPANWNGNNSLDIGADDGDTIAAVVNQVDRLVVLKRNSAWVVEGDDINSFRVFRLYNGAGASGPRAATAVGSVVYFFGDQGFHRIRGNTVEPFGWLEVGHLFDTFKTSQTADVVVKNYLGQYVLVFYSSSESYNNDCLVYDLRFGAWTRFTGWHFADVLQQKVATFGDAQTLLAIDRRDMDSGAGFDYPVWMAFHGNKDGRTSAGTGGTPPAVVIETPMIDDGDPAQEKMWEKVQAFVSGVNVTATLSVITDPNGTASVSLEANQSGAVWSLDPGGAPGTPNWGAFNWATAMDSGPHIGLPLGTYGRRYAVRVVSNPEADFIFRGYALEGIVQPMNDYSRS